MGVMALARSSNKWGVLMRMRIMECGRGCGGAEDKALSTEGDHISIFKLEVICDAEVDAVGALEVFEQNFAFLRLCERSVPA